MTAKTATKTKAADTAKVTEATKTEPLTTTVAVQQVERFEPDPDQATWLKLEEEREAKRLDPATNPFIAASEAGIAFINAPALNDQWIGKIPTEETYRGVPVSSFRIVPLNTSEVLQAGRKVILPSGNNFVLPAGITNPFQIVHPETGERLLEEPKAKK